MNNYREIETHFFNFSPDENSGEGLTLTTKYFSEGDIDKRGIFVNQELTLSSYGNCATFTLCGINITPQKLRQLADELDAINKRLYPQHDSH